MSGRPRRKTYSPEAERLLAELSADVRAGRIRSTSPEYRRRWQRAAAGLPGAGTPRSATRIEAPAAPREPRSTTGVCPPYDGIAAPPEGTRLEVRARAIAAERGCTFTLVDSIAAKLEQTKSELDGITGDQAASV